MKRTMLTVLSVLLLGLMPLVATAQGMPPLPATPVPGEAPVGVLAEFTVPELPTPHAEVWFLRFSLEPGGSLPEETQIGPVIAYVESGTLTLDSNAAVEVASASTPEAGATPAGITRTVLQAGDSVSIPAGTTMYVSNTSEQPVTFLVLLMYAAEREGSMAQGADEPVGLSQMGVSIGTAEFMPIPASVRIERVVIEPGATVEPGTNASEMKFPGYLGMEVGAVETGSAEVVLNSGSMSNMTWPGMATSGMPQPEMVPLTATVQLATGDAYSFGGSTLTWTNSGGEPLTILRVVILPEIPAE